MIGKNTTLRRPLMKTDRSPLTPPRIVLIQEVGWPRLDLLVAN